MRPILHFVRFAIAGGLVASALGCASSARPAEPSSSTEDESLSTTSDRLVSIRPDLRRCLAPLCGGYWARDLNSYGAERYVSSIDFGATGLDDATVADALGDPGRLVVRGRLGPADPRYGTRALVATDVWRGMPGIDADSFDDFYTVARRDPPIVCITAPCSNLIATVANTRVRYAFDGVDVAPSAISSFVDQAWLGARVVDHGAVVAASWERGDHFPGGYAWLLRATQVFVHLPDRVGPCPAAPTPRCDEGTIAAYQRNDDRCVIQVACVTPTVCPMYLPVCADGYTLASWTSESSCLAFACDPTFVTK